MGLLFVRRSSGIPRPLLIIMKKKSKAGIVVLGALVLLVIAGYFIFNWTMSMMVHSLKEVTVPDINGKTYQEAVSLLTPLSLEVKQEAVEFDPNAPAGTIIRQTPSAGMTVREGKSVRVVISQGGQEVGVPNVVGQAVRSAEIALRSAGLILGEEASRPSVVMEKDHVLTQDPAAGSPVEKDAVVNLVISAGAPPAGTRLMPEWTGRTIIEARDWAEKNGVTPVITEESIVGAQPGTVLRQEPVADTDITSSASVTFVVAK